MATRKKTVNYNNVPQTLSEHPFFGLQLDEEQIAFRDAIWDPTKLVVMCNANAGSGKTLISVMTAQLLYRYGRYNGIVYITAPTQQAKIGMLPGTAEQKTAIYGQPFYEAAIKANINMQQSMVGNIDAEKNGTAYIQVVPHNYLRGVNFENKVVIVDEAQNFYFDQLKKVLTRVHDSCKLIVIGHTGQCDLFHRPQNSGFRSYINHFSNVEWASVCNLTKNYRGLISSYADSAVLNNSINDQTYGNIHRQKRNYIFGFDIGSDNNGEE